MRLWTGGRSRRNDDNDNVDTDGVAAELDADPANTETLGSDTVCGDGFAVTDLDTGGDGHGDPAGTDGLAVTANGATSNGTDDDTGNDDTGNDDNAASGNASNGDTSNGDTSNGSASNGNGSNDSASDASPTNGDHTHSDGATIPPMPDLAPGDIPGLTALDFEVAEEWAPPVDPNGQDTDGPGSEEAPVNEDQSASAVGPVPTTDETDPAPQTEPTDDGQAELEVTDDTASDDTAPDDPEPDDTAPDDDHADDRGDDTDADSGSTSDESPVADGAEADLDVVEVGEVDQNEHDDATGEVEGEGDVDESSAPTELDDDHGAAGDPAEHGDPAAIEHDDTAAEADPDGDHDSAPAVDDDAEGRPELDDELQHVAESNDRNGPPAVGDGLRRGVTPGQAEGPVASPIPVVAKPAVIVVAAFAILGLLAGLVRGSDDVVRRDLVYTLDESVPDGFLREDRRLLTQVVTMQSDAVLAPVAEEHDLTIDEVRDRLDVETVELSEVLRLEVRGPDVATARSISDSVIDRYLIVSTASAPAGDNAALLEERAAIAAELAAADDRLRSSETEDVRLRSAEESLERRIDLVQRQIDRLQGLLDDALVQPGPAAQRAVLQTELTTAEADLAELDAQLAQVRVDRAELQRAGTERSLSRDVARLETDLATIDDELAARELGPLVAAPIRELGEPTVVDGSAAAGARRGLALGVLVGLPAAAAAAIVVRRRQLWRR